MTDTGHGYALQADALFGLRRFQECIQAAKQAIRWSDGKYARMHFRLGLAYFETENWEMSRQSFQKAAEMDTRDPAAAHNLALCMARLGFYRDAAKWYEEALRRDPKHPDREDILREIAALRGE
jgi:tetratricopeptide (TPR) repeat protein